MLVEGGNKVNICIEFFIESILILHFISLLIAATFPNFLNIKLFVRKQWRLTAPNLADRAGSLPYPGLCPTGHEQGVQGRPADGHHIQPRVQSIRQVHKNKAGLRSNQDISPWLGPSRAELETRILSVSQGQGLMAAGWAEMVLLGPWRGPRGAQDFLLCLHMSTKNQAMYTETFNLETGMKMPNVPVHSYAKYREVVAVIIAIKIHSTNYHGSKAANVCN